MYEILKYAHLTALAVSFVLFFTRGILMMRQSSTANHRGFLIAPHIFNFLLILTGVSLAFTLQITPMTQPWLMAKMVVLIVYIGLGVMTYKHPNLQVRKILWLLALIAFAFMASIAKTKNPLGFLAGFF